MYFSLFGKVFLMYKTYNIKYIFTYDYRIYLEALHSALLNFL